MKVKVDWETDNQNVGLPEIVETPDIPEGEIADYLSDHFGWLVKSFIIIGS